MSTIFVPQSLMGITHPTAVDFVIINGRWVCFPHGALSQSELSTLLKLSRCSGKVHAHLAAIPATSVMIRLLPAHYLELPKSHAHNAGSGLQNFLVCWFDDRSTFYAEPSGMPKGRPGLLFPWAQATPPGAELSRSIDSKIDEELSRLIQVVNCAALCWREALSGTERQRDTAPPATPLADSTGPIASCTTATTETATDAGIADERQQADPYHRAQALAARSEALWDSLDSWTLVAFDAILGIYVLPMLMTRVLYFLTLARAPAITETHLTEGLFVLYELTTRHTIQPWLASVAGDEQYHESWLSVSHATGAAHFAGRRLAQLLLSLLGHWDRLAYSFLLPYCGTVLHMAYTCRYVAGTKLSSIVARLVLQVCSLHVRALVFLSGSVYATAGRILLSLWRLFRGKKCNVLRMRVDTAEADVSQLLVGTLLFVPLFLFLPVLAMHYAVFCFTWLCILALVAGLWWAKKVAYTLPAARAVCVLVPLTKFSSNPLLLPPCMGVTFQPHPSEPIADGRSDDSSLHRHAGAGTRSSKEKTAKVLLPVRVLQLVRHDATLVDVMHAWIRSVWSGLVKEGYGPKAVLLAALTGQTLPS